MTFSAETSRPPSPPTLSLLSGPANKAAIVKENKKIHPNKLEDLIGVIKRFMDRAAFIWQPEAGSSGLHKMKRFFFFFFYRQKGFF